MKNYSKPTIEICRLQINSLASLNDWLTTNGLTEAGITTYVVNS